MPGRSTLTATGVPSGSSAKCTCATDALATGTGVERSEHLVDRPAVRRASASPRPARYGNGGTRSCSFASSSAMSVGSRSRRVDSTWPNLTKIGPRLSSASAQAHRARARQVAPERDAVDERPQPANALVAEQELVETVALRHGQDAEQSRQAHGRDCRGRPAAAPVARQRATPSMHGLRLANGGVVRRRMSTGCA